MEPLLIILWCIGAAIGLTWCWLMLRDRELLSRPPKTLKPHLHYVVISPALLSEWETHELNLMIIDLRDKSDAGRGDGIPDDGIKDSLRIPGARLCAGLRWIPPATRLVFYSRDRIGPFGAAVEKVLVEAGIEAVYLLDGGIGAWNSFIAQQGALLHGSSTAAAHGTKADI